MGLKGRRVPLTLGLAGRKCKERRNQRLEPSISPSRKDPSKSQIISLGGGTTVTPCPCTQQFPAHKPSAFTPWVLSDPHHSLELTRRCC